MYFIPIVSRVRSSHHIVFLALSLFIASSAAADYSRNSHRTQRTDRNGQTNTYTFDALNREIHRSYSGAQGEDIAQETRTPDGNGNVIQIVQTRANGTSHSTTRHSIRSTGCSTSPIAPVTR